MTDALINLRVPAATKAAWVRKSRAAGMRLTGWIVESVNARLAGGLQIGIYHASVSYHGGKYVPVHLSAINDAAALREIHDIVIAGPPNATCVRAATRDDTYYFARNVNGLVVVVVIRLGVSPAGVDVEYAGDSDDE